MLIFESALVKRVPIQPAYTCLTRSNKTRASRSNENLEILSFVRLNVCNRAFFNFKYS